jgi:hypothetical protein
LSGRTMVSTPPLSTQSAPIFVLRPNHSVDPEPKYAPADILTPDRPWPDLSTRIMISSMILFEVLEVPNNRGSGGIVFGVDIL